MGVQQSAEVVVVARSPVPQRTEPVMSGQSRVLSELVRTEVIIEG
jgi:hypothetical protein